MQILTIIALVLLVVVTIVFSVLLHKCLIRIEELGDESKLNKALILDATARSVSNLTVMAQLQHAHDVLDGEFRDFCSKNQPEQQKQVSERRALYKELRAVHSVKETANLMGISDTTARRYEKWLNGMCRK